MNNSKNMVKMYVVVNPTTNEFLGVNIDGCCCWVKNISLAIKTVKKSHFKEFNFLENKWYYVKKTYTNYNLSN